MCVLLAKVAHLSNTYSQMIAQFVIYAEWIVKWATIPSLSEQLMNTFFVACVKWSLENWGCFHQTAKCRVTTTDVIRRNNASDDVTAYRDQWIMSCILTACIEHLHYLLIAMESAYSLYSLNYIRGSLVLIFTILTQEVCQKYFVWFILIIYDQ